MPVFTNMHHATGMHGEMKHRSTRCKDGTTTQVCSQLHAQITLHPGTKRMVPGLALDSL